MTGKAAGKRSIKNKRNTQSATQRRIQLTKEHDVLVLEALQAVLKHASHQPITYDLLAKFLNTRTNLKTQRGNKFSRDGVYQILKRNNCNL